MATLFETKHQDKLLGKLTPDATITAIEQVFTTVLGLEPEYPLTARLACRLPTWTYRYGSADG